MKKIAVSICTLIALCVLPVSAQSIRNSSDYNVFARKFTLDSLYLCRKFKCTFSSSVVNTLPIYDIGRKNSNPKIQFDFTDSVNLNKIVSIQLQIDVSRNLTLSASEINEQIYRILGVRKVWVLYCDSPYEGQGIYLRHKAGFACFESPTQIMFMVAVN